MAETNVNKSRRQSETKMEGTPYTYQPRVDIIETDEGFTLYADVPGAKPEDIDVRYEKGELMLHARCRPRHENVRWLYREYGVGYFYRSFTIEGIDPDKIKAEVKNGVLKIHLPKPEAAKPKKITVTAAS
ncbi:MAG: molecular chaperone [Gemmatales bacterium]|nr:MAG: molecular chaperone [Gemmatales bacterium]